MKIFLSAFFWPFYSWLLISVAAPTSVSSPQFVHIQEKDALRISISKNSPPIAAISDEVSAQVTFEPVEDVVVDKNSVQMVIGKNNYWPQLKKYSDNFEKEQIKQIELKAKAAELEAKLIINNKLEAAQRFQTPAVVVNAFRITELTRLVQPVKETYQVNKEVTAEVPAVTATVQVAAAPQTIVTAPVTQKEIQQVVQKEIQREIRIAKNIKKPSHLVKAQEVLGFDGEDLSNKYTLKGQIELSGGLALIENLNNLRVFWKTALKEEDAMVDYSTGKFLVSVNNIDAGKLVAHLYDENQKITGIGSIDLSEESKDSKVLESIKLLIEPLESSKGGQIISAYSYDKFKIMVPNAEVFGAAQARELVDYKGLYKLAALGGSSTYQLQAHAPEHWITQSIVESGKSQVVPLFPYKMLQNFFEIINQNANASEYGVIWGKITKKDKALAGAEVKLSSAEAVGPIYFNELFIPDKNLTKTSSNGLFAFVKVNPGLKVIFSKYEDKELPSSVVNTNPGVVSYTEIQAKALQLKGFVFDPIYQHKVPSQISVVGTQQAITANAEGFEIKIPSSDSVVHMNFNNGPEYFLTREAVPRSLSKNVLALAIRKAWLTEELRRVQFKQEESLGLAFGYVKGKQFSVSLDNEKVDDQNIFYFDEHSKIDPSKADSGENGGPVLITNLSPGLHTLVITSSDGQITNTRLFVSEAGVVNTFNFELKH